MIRRALVVAALGALAACGNDTEESRPAGDPRTFRECTGDPPSFVRQAFLALDGRRPRSQAEVDAYVDLYTQAAEQQRDAPALVARAIMERPAFVERWVDVLMDAMFVQRTDLLTEQKCWDAGTRATTTPALAAAVRDQLASGAGDGAPFAMIDLARSAIALDDLTPLYRGQLFSLVSHPTLAANAGLREAELARRAGLASTFEAAFLHRDTTCLGCHTSETSVTNADDLARDRHWPVPGAPERAVYGAPTGGAVEQAQAVFRVRNFAAAAIDPPPDPALPPPDPALPPPPVPTLRPWGWQASCGMFVPPSEIADDVDGVAAKFAGITGVRATVFDLDAALMRGFAALRATGAPTADLADPDAALAWLVTLKITEDVWRQATGTRLTIANYFPRNEAAREQLYALAKQFVASSYSLKALLVAIVTSDYFNRQTAEQGCGAQPYTYPNVFDPWVLADANPSRRLNGPGDAVTSVDSRTLVAAASAALEWPPGPFESRFPDYGDPELCNDLPCDVQAQACSAQGLCCNTHEIVCERGGPTPAAELSFQRGVGLFLRSSERGFRGLDFQARLAWESRYGACRKPAWVDEDFIDRLAAAGATDPAATARDAIAALKDRLIGEPAIADGAETAALAAITGDLAGPASGVPADALRRICGALLGSPQFLLQGIAGRGGPRPRLTPSDASYAAVCADLAATGLGTPGLAVTCSGDVLTLH